MSKATSETSSSSSGIRSAKPVSVVTVVKEWAAVTTGVMVLLGGFAAFVLGTAHAQTAEIVQAVRADAGAAASKADVVARRLEQHEKESAAVHLEIRDDVHELQKDIRELYRVVRDGRRSERLEAPPRQDGGL